MSYFFNAPIQLPVSSNLAISASAANKLFFNANTSMSSSLALTFPAADGSANQVLSTDGNGNLAFVDQSGSSSVASNAIINSTSGDIAFTTDSGNVNVGTTSGNLTINTDGASDFMHLVGNNQIFISTNGNTVQNQSDTSNLTALFDNNYIGFNKYISVTDTTQASGVGFTGSASIITYGGASIEKDAVVGGNVEIISNGSNAVVLKVNDSMTSSLELTLPSTDGTSGQVLQTNGSGILSFTDVSSTTSLDAANITIASAGEDVVFATTQGTANIGTYSGSTSVYALGGSNVVILSASANEPTSTSDTGNISLTISNTAVTSHRATTLESTLDVTGVTNLNDTTTSTNTTSGALVVDGGVGIAENLNVGGSVTVTGDLTVNGTTTTINSNVTTVDDPVIQIGTDSNDDLDRGIKALYNDGSSKAAFFGWQRNGVNDEFTFIPDATFSSANVATGTIGDAKFFNMDLSGNLNVDGTTQSTSVSSGALIVDGGTGVAKNLYVGGNVNVADTTTLQSTLDVTGATTLSSTLEVTSTTTLNGQTNVNDKLVVSVDEFDASVGSTTDVWNGSNSSVNKHILTNPGGSGLSNYSSSGSYTTGQMMNIFFTNNTGGSSSANLDFGTSNLYSGSGTAQYLVFNTTGQSASLIYINASGANDGWRIINTGATVH